MFRSTGIDGFSNALDAESSKQFARKLPQEVAVEFTTADRAIDTPEGSIRARAGDAIVTGTLGERWCVSRERFQRKYQPVAPTTMDSAGRYISIPTRVIAARPIGPFEVVLADGQSVLHGRSGDWVVDYGDGSLGVVAANVFAATYEIEP
ncbi:MAG TPA: PGDYG domain-containing protein [Steroidobacteraceae bacterium]